MHSQRFPNRANRNLTSTTNRQLVSIAPQPSTLKPKQTLEPEGDLRPEPQVPSSLSGRTLHAVWGGTTSAVRRTVCNLRLESLALRAKGGGLGLYRDLVVGGFGV